MRTGHLVLETRPEGPGLVYVVKRSAAPNLTQPGLLFAARFEDLEAAFMHFHEEVRRALVGLEPRRYRIDAVTAVAAADAIELAHRRVFIDPRLASDQRLTVRTQALRRRHKRTSAFFYTVGLLALLGLICFELFVRVPI